jgi:hypothetical protein
MTDSLCGAFFASNLCEVILCTKLMQLIDAKVCYCPIQANKIKEVLL